MRFRMVIQTLSLVLLAVALIRGPGLAIDDTESDRSQVTLTDDGSIEETSSDETQPELGEIVEAPEDVETVRPSDFAMDVTDINWPDWVVQPPEIEPLFVRAFTEIAAGYTDSNPIWSPAGGLIAF